MLLSCCLPLFQFVCHFGTSVWLNINQVQDCFFFSETWHLSSIGLQYMLIHFFPILYIVNSLKCHHCLSSLSAANCSKSSKETKCPDVADSCANISTEVYTETGSLKSFFYGCATQQMCSDAKEKLTICDTIKQRGYKVECNITCCSTGDFCLPLPNTTSTSTSTLTSTSGHSPASSGVTLELSRFLVATYAFFILLN